MEVVLWLEKHVRIVGSSLSSPQIMEESVLDVDIKCLCRLMKVRAEKGKNVQIVGRALFLIINVQIVVRHILFNSNIISA